jgi:hypothetical protein
LRAEGRAEQREDVRSCETRGRKWTWRLAKPRCFHAGREVRGAIVSVTGFDAGREVSRGLTRARRGATVWVTGFDAGREMSRARSRGLMRAERGVAPQPSRLGLRDWSLIGSASPSPLPSFCTLPQPPSPSLPPPLQPLELIGVRQARHHHSFW